MRALLFAAVALLSIAGSACAQCGCQLECGRHNCPDLRAFGNGCGPRPIFLCPINWGRCYGEYTAHRAYVNGQATMPPCPPPAYRACQPSN